MSFITIIELAGHKNGLAWSNKSLNSLLYIKRARIHNQICNHVIRSKYVRRDINEIL